MFRSLTICAAAALAMSSTAAAKEASPAFPAGKILMLTPNVDGVADKGEYSEVYTIKTGGEVAFVGMGWDSKDLFFCLKGPKLVKGIIYIDAHNDGWLNGADNFEVTLSPDSENGVAVKLYNSMVNSPSKALVPVVIPAKLVSGKDSSGSFVYEAMLNGVSVPELKPAPLKKMGIAAGIALASEPSELLPKDTRSSMQPVELVQQLEAEISGLDLSMVVRDRRVVPGQKLILNFYANNRSNAPLEYKSFVIGGEARIASLLNTSRIRGDRIKAGKRVKQGYQTELPSDMPTGAFAISAEMILADDTVSKLMSSFEVVEPIEVVFDTGDGPVGIGQTRKLTVTIKNNRPRTSGGSVKLIVPMELQRGLDKERGRFTANFQDDLVNVDFKLTVPEGVKPGEYEIEADVETSGYTRTLKGKILIL